MAKNPKQKGSAYERSICSRLSLWVSNYTRKDIFWRTATSGGRATTLAKKGEVLSSQAGDIGAIDSLGEVLTDVFFMECKYYKDLKVDRAFFGKPEASTFVNFWVHAQREAKKYEKLPILFYKQNNRGEGIALNSQGVKWFRLSESKAVVVMPKYDLFIYTSEHFFTREFRRPRKKTKRRECFNDTNNQ